jgi:hypothetical protein
MVFLMVVCAGCGGGNVAGPISVSATSGTAKTPGANGVVLPLEVDMNMAEEFVRIGFGLNANQRFHVTEFLTPGLRTRQACQLIRMVKSYNQFDGEKVAAALAAFEGQVSAVEFGREGSPVMYVELPYWTHQREGVTPLNTGIRISDEDTEKLVSAMRKAFVETLGAEEFSADGRRVRIWWH